MFNLFHQCVSRWLAIISSIGSGVSNAFTAPFTYPPFFTTDTQTYLADLDNMTKCFLVVGVE